MIIDGKHYILTVQQISEHVFMVSSVGMPGLLIPFRDFSDLTKIVPVVVRGLLAAT